MKVGNSLESIIDKALTPIRISPAGVLGLVGGPALLAGGLTLTQSDSWVSNVGAAMLGSTFGVSVYGIMLYSWGVTFYLQAKRLMKFKTAKRHISKIVEPNIAPYCTRQAYHAAAINSGFGKDFREIKNKYTGPRLNTWLPGV